LPGLGRARRRAALVCIAGLALDGSGARPAHCLTSGHGCSAGILELTGCLIPATQVLGFATSGIETLIEILLVVRKRPVDAALPNGKSGAARRIAGLIEEPAALLLHAFFGARLRRDAMPQQVAS
jgi:hypothetical protein